MCIPVPVFLAAAADLLAIYGMIAASRASPRCRAVFLSRRSHDGGLDIRACPGWSLPLVDLMPMLPTGVTPANFFLM